MSDTDATGDVGPRTRTGIIQIGGGKRVEMPPQMEMAEISAEDKPRFAAIGKTLKAYRDAGKDLLAGTYTAFAQLAPAALGPDYDATAILCEDGVVVRWEPKTGDKPVVRVGRIHGGDNTVTAVAPVVSDGFVYCPRNLAAFVLPADGPMIGMSKTDGITGEVSPLFRTRIGVVVDWDSVRDNVVNGTRPEPVISISNEVEVELGLEEFDADDPEPRRGTGEQVIVRVPMKLGQTWEQIQIFQPFDPVRWTPAIAAGWAEHDLLAEAARRNLRDQKYRDLDPNVAARKGALALLQEFELLLDGPEAPIQAFLERHPQLLSPTHLKVWRKLPLGGRTTDFVFCEPSNEYLLVEIEAPGRRLYRKDGQQHEELTHAIDQTNDWLRYIEDNPQYVQNELKLTGMSTSPSRLVVIGRSSDLTPDDRRKLTTLHNATPKLRVVTYDDVLATAKRSMENTLGPLGATTGTAEVYRIPRT